MVASVRLVAGTVGGDCGSGSCPAVVEDVGGGRSELVDSVVVVVVVVVWASAAPDAPAMTTAALAKIKDSHKSKSDFIDCARTFVFVIGK